MIIIDDSDAGFSLDNPGSWTIANGGAFAVNGWYHYAPANHGLAHWTFSGLVAGTYQVSVSWGGNPYNPSDVAYTIHSGSTTTTINIDQRPQPAGGPSIGTVATQILAPNFHVATGELVVSVPSGAWVDAAVLVLVLADPPPSSGHHKPKQIPLRSPKPRLPFRGR